MHNELSGEDFYDRYCSGTAPTIDRHNGKLAMSMIFTAIMTSEEIEGTEEWVLAEKSITRLNLFEESMFSDT